MLQIVSGRWLVVAVACVLAVNSWEPVHAERGRRGPETNGGSRRSRGGENAGNHGAAGEESTGDRWRRSEFSLEKRWDNGEISWEKKWGKGEEPSGEKEHHRKRRRYVPQHEHAQNSPVGSVILDYGFPSMQPPPPRLLSRGSYTVVDMPSGVSTAGRLRLSSARASDFMAAAEREFRQTNYEAAWRWVRHAQIEEPQHERLQLLAGQVLFATGDFPAAAEAIAEVYSKPPGQPWAELQAAHRAWHVSGDYLVQMSRLGAFIGQHGNDSRALFLRGHQFAVFSERDAAVADLEKAVLLDPEFSAATQLLSMIRMGEEAEGTDSADTARGAAGSELLVPPVEYELLPPMTE